MEFISKSDEFNNQFIEFELFNVQPDEEKQFKLKYEVVAHSQKTDTLECEGELITGFTEPEKYIESDAEGIIDLSQHLSKETTDVCQQVRTFYDFVAENIEYHPVHTPEDYGAIKALEYKSGDCTEFSDLMIALSRSAGIPARFVEGIVSSPGEEEHDWVQVYLPGSGWTTMEPTWGRHEELREIYFAGTTPDHIILSTGRNLTALNNKHFWSSRFWWDKKLSQPVVKIKSDWEVTPKH